MFGMHSSDHNNLPVLLSALGGDPESLRAVLRALAAAAGYHPDALMEWSSADAPALSEHPSDLPSLYYAALLPADPHADLPLGLGDTPAAALTDLLWTLGGSHLLAALQADSAPPDPPTTPRAATAHAPIAADPRCEEH